MKRLIAGPRSPVLVAALAVIAAMCTASTAHAASASDSVIPAAPSNLTATAVSPDSVRLTWTNNAANQSGVVISLDGVDSVDVQGATVSSYTGDGLSPGTKYWFYIASKIYGTPGDPTGSGNTQSAWVGPVYATTPNTSGSTDWADSNFCSSYGAHAGVTYKGVTACGNSEAVGNDQGTISYLTPSGSRVYFDSVGFQCVELAARYLYFQATLIPDSPTTPPTGTAFVSTEHQNYSQIAISGVTDTFQNSITPGNIISMWSRSDPTGEGHVGVVMGFQYTNGNLTGINIMDENADGSGTSMIKVSGGTMSFDGYNEFQWTTNLPGSG
jgi:hypothetical protein